MKILFMRHAQDQDDVDNKYGGWSDSPLTERGKQIIFSKIVDIQNLNIPFTKIISSPLQRAYQSANIISKEMNIEVEMMESLKEWNK
jgi:2,3-bisphosphoglycerate-dependent phosphoglycerate mutase